MSNCRRTLFYYLRDTPFLRIQKAVFDHSAFVDESDESVRNAVELIKQKLQDFMGNRLLHGGTVGIHM